MNNVTSISNGINASHLGMIVRVIVLTPEMAAEYLANRAPNRPLSARYVAKLVRAIRSGRWVTMHQGIATNSAGQLVDGQHRCEAVRQSGASVSIVLTQYTDDETAARAIGATDQGNKKTAAHVMAMQSLVESHKSARYEALARALIIGHTGSTSSVDEFEVIRTTNRFRHEFDWATALTRRYMKAPDLAAFAYAYPAAPEKVAEAARRIIHGADMQYRSPLWHLSQHIQNRGTLGYQDYQDSFVRALRALEAFVQDKDIKQLKGTITDAAGHPKAIAYWDIARGQKGHCVGVMTEPLRIAG